MRARIAMGVGFAVLAAVPAYGDRYLGGGGGGGRDGGGGGTYGNGAPPVVGTGMGPMVTVPNFQRQQMNPGVTTPQPQRMERPPTGTIPPMERPPTGTIPPMERPPTGTIPPMERPPTGTIPPMERPPTGTIPPMERPPTGNTPGGPPPIEYPTGPRDDSPSYYEIGGLWASSWVPWWEMHKDRFLRDPSWRAPRLSAEPEPGYEISGQPVQEPAPEAPPAEVLAFLRRRTEDSEARVVRAALVALGKFAQAEDVPCLVRALGTGAVPVRQGAAVGLGLHGSVQACAALRQAIASPDTPMPVRQMAVLGLGLASGSDEDVAALSRLLEGRTNDATLRALAASSLGALGKRPELLVEVLRNPGQPAPCRVACALALAQQKGPRPGLVPRDLLQMYRQQASNEMHRGLAIAFGRLLTAQEARDFVTLLRSEQDAVTQNYAMMSLCALGSPEALDAVKRSLADVNRTPVLRAYCALGLASNNCAGASEAIGAALGRVRDRSEQAGLLLALSLLEKPERREDPETGLLSAMIVDRSYSDLQGYAGIAGFLALEEIGAEGVRETNAAQDRSPGFLRSGLLVLGANRDEQDLGTLYGMLEDPDRYVRGSAVQGLGWSGHASVVGEMLSRAGSDDAAATLREEACTVLGLLLQPERSRKILAFMDLCEPTHAPEVMFALLETI